MSRYRIEFTRSARKELERLPTKDRLHVAAAIELLSAVPRPAGCRPVIGARQKGTYRIRIGNYRVVYVIRDDELLIIVGPIGHRKDVYRN